MIDLISETYYTEGSMDLWLFPGREQPHAMKPTE